MDPNAKLELTWIEKASPFGREPRLRLECAGDGSGENPAVQCREAGLNICGNPRCGCEEIRLQWLVAPTGTPAASAPSAGEFWFNLNIMSPSVTRHHDPDPAALHLVERLRATLTAADLQQLGEWYLATKLDLIQTTPPDKMDLTGLPDASDGLLIGFPDVFPLGLALYFEFQQEVWMGFEQYCVQPDCDCTDAMLSFYKLKEATGRRVTEAADPATLRYDYRTGAITLEPEWPTGRLSADDLLGSLKLRHADLHGQLALRHRILRRLYARHNLAESRALAQYLESRPAAVSTVAPAKIGRNDPCPCGSGRKYKRCCLNANGL